MFHRIIISFLIFLIGVLVLNWLVYEILAVFSNFPIDVYGPNGVILFVENVGRFLQGLLFRNSLFDFQYSFILSSLSLIYFVLYWVRVRRKQKHTMLDSLREDFAAFLGPFIVFIGLCFLLGIPGWYLFILLIPDILTFCFRLFCSYPYELGWQFVLQVDGIFKDPGVYLELYSRAVFGSFFFTRLVTLVLAMILMYLLLRVKRMKAPDLTLRNDDYINEKFIRRAGLEIRIFMSRYPGLIKLFQFLYFVFLAPSIFLWFYPFSLSLLGLIPFNSIPMEYKVLGFLLIILFFVTISCVFRVNIAEIASRIKEEIKEEINNKSSS